MRSIYPCTKEGRIEQDMKTNRFLWGNVITSILGIYPSLYCQLYFDEAKQEGNRNGNVVFILPI